MVAITAYIVLGVGCWMILNGILHDIFVIRQHKTSYDRELLRLLMDGHVLLTCGVIQIITFNGLILNETWAYSIATVASVSLLLYCAMIFPFLKSIGTILMNLTVLILLAINYFTS